MAYAESLVTIHCPFQLSRLNQVFHVHLDKFVWSKMNELKNMVGQEGFQQLLATVDLDIMSQLQTFMKPYTAGM